MRISRAWLVLLFACAGVARAEENAVPDAKECEPSKASLAKACASGEEPKLAGKAGSDCDAGVAKLKAIDERVQAVKKECSKAASATSVKAAKKGRGDQALAPKDTAALATSSQGLMEKCEQKMTALQKLYQSFVEDAQKAIDAVPAPDLACGKQAVEMYKKLQDIAQRKATETGELVNQYANGASAAKAVASRNSKASDSLGGDQQSAGGGGSGGGAPQLPTPPQPQKSKEKSAQELLAEQQAAKQKACTDAIAAYTNAIGTCKNTYPCNSGMVVEWECKLYNSCIGTAPAIPGDCPNQPARAQPVPLTP